MNVVIFDIRCKVLLNTQDWRFLPTYLLHTSQYSWVRPTGSICISFYCFCYCHFS